jgi:membrane-associated protease RseP (regulator of RpoE activity)
MGLLEVIASYKWVIIFYSLIILFIILMRKKFEFHGKIIALYKTGFGLSMIERVGKKHAAIIKILGYCGIGVGFIGMAAIVILILKGLWDLVLVPGAPPVISPVLPGIPIPGSPIQVPLIEGWIALFIVVLIHEFSHGIVAAAHNIRVKSTGLLFFGPLLGAFVEPDEKQVEKKGDVVKYSIFAAGPFSNVLLALAAILLIVFAVSPAINNYAAPEGFVFTKVDDDLPAYKAGLEAGVTYNLVNGEKINSALEFEKALAPVKPGEAVTIGNSLGSYNVTTTFREEAPEKALIGVNIRTKLTNEGSAWLNVLLWANGLIAWIFILSLGLGLANLLPIGPVDGGRMIKEALENTLGKSKGLKVWAKLTIVLIALILILLLVPIIKHLIG